MGKKAFYKVVASFFDDCSGEAQVYLSRDDFERRWTTEPEIHFDSLEDLEDQLQRRYEMEA